ncbi:cytochrome P450 [Apiospora arundinis]|uniref:Cytochrome P450 n=1 Tax=Apiospora arundinis TaxID=335852 RepID=A0ABR2I9F6_9PEZI
MAPILAVAFGILATTYCFFHFLLYATQDPREPRAILTTIPYLQPLLRMIKEKSGLHLSLNQKYGLPIYTLRMPFQRVYVVNDTSLIPVLQRHWRTISFAAITANAGAVCGMSKASAKIMNHELSNEDGFSISWPKYITPSLAPGKDLDAINKKSVEIISQELAKQRAKGPVTTGLGEWTKQLMITSTTEAIYGPLSPYKDEAITEAWKIFETGFLTFAIFPAAMMFFPKIHHARELAAAAMIKYIRQGGHEQASGLVRRRFEHHRQWGLSLDDIGRGEVGNTFAVLGNSSPAAFWMMYHIFSDEKVLADVRQELLGLVHDQGEGGVESFIDLADIRSSCPVLLSTFQEVLRYRTIGVGPRAVLEDVVLEDQQILLKKGSLLMIPSTVQHNSIKAWGDDASEFRHTRFLPNQQGKDKYNRAAFRAFGGGQTLCPGRHFASTEIMMLAAVSVLQFDVLPIEGRWVEPTTEKSPSGASFPVPDEDIKVHIRPRDLDKKWHISFSGSGEPIRIALEDMS